MMTRQIGPRPEPGRYVSSHGVKCWVLIGREATLIEDGSVRVKYDNHCFTSAYFRTFERWGFRRLPDDEQ